MNKYTPRMYKNISLPDEIWFGMYSDIARKTDNQLSRQHISKVLRGVVGYSSRSLSLIASACKVEVGWLADYIEVVKGNRQ